MIRLIKLHLWISCLLVPAAITSQMVQTKIPITLSVRNVSLDKVLKIISEKSGLSFIPDPAVSNMKITTELSDINPHEALKIIAKLYNLGFQELGTTGKYVVTELSAIAVETEIGFYICEFAPAEVMVPIVEKFLTPDVGNVIIDGRTNTLIYRDTSENLREIERILNTLDRSPRQVYIKSIIAEVSLTKSTDTGIQWFTESDNFKAATDFGIKSVPSELPLQPERPSGTGLGIGILDMDIDVAITMLATKNDLNLLSTPYLITLENHWATIEVGDQIPYQKLNEYGITSYEFKDATIKLKLRPQINNDSTITIYLEPQANFQQGFTPDGVPIIATRSAKTQIVVENGKTVVIGGIMQESDVVNETRIPLLGAIPLIGKLFKSSRITRQKTELVVMLMPEIVTDDLIRLSNKVTDRFPEKMKAKIQ